VASFRRNTAPIPKRCTVNAMNNYAEAKEALQKIFRQLERINPSAARSLEEGLEETLSDCTCLRIPRLFRVGG
jgi:hypothetical protein